MDAFRNDMHGRLLRDEIPAYDYLIELAPFALEFMTTRELSYMGACEQIIIGTRCESVICVFSGKAWAANISEILLS